MRLFNVIHCKCDCCILISLLAIIIEMKRTSPSVCDTIINNSQFRRIRSDWSSLLFNYFTLTRGHVLLFFVLPRCSQASTLRLPFKSMIMHRETAKYFSFDRFENLPFKCNFPGKHSTNPIEPLSISKGKCMKRTFDFHSKTIKCIKSIDASTKRLKDSTAQNHFKELTLKCC